MPESFDTTTTGRAYARARALTMFPCTGACYPGWCVCTDETRAARGAAYVDACDVLGIPVESAVSEETVSLNTAVESGWARDSRTARKAWKALRQLRSLYPATADRAFWTQEA